MRIAIALALAAGLTAVPASAQGTNQTNGTGAQTTAPANSTATTQQPVLPVTNEAATAPIAAPAPEAGYPPPPAPHRSFPWGILGLVGLIGLLGRARS